MIKRILRLVNRTVLRLCYRLLNSRNNRNLRGQYKAFYPFDEYGRLWFSRLMFPQGNAGYCAQFYKERFITSSLALHHLHEAAEVLYVEKHRENASLHLSEECLLPVAVSSTGYTHLDSDVGLSLFLNGEEKKVSELIPERYYYLPIPKGSDVQISSASRDIFVGNPLNLRDDTAGPKLVLPIFVDGLAYDFFSPETLPEIMPRTHEFFSKGTIFHDCHAMSEWTLPSVASIFTGLNTQHHGIFHPRTGQILDERYPILSEMFKDEGYLTAQICCNARKNPSLGYARGFDRTLYRMEMDCSEGVTELLNVLDGFPGRSQFVWLTLWDLHSRTTHVPSIDIQTRSDLKMYGSSRAKGNRNEYDTSSIGYYHLELKRIDRHLGFIYDYITKHYQDEEILVLLLTDHGQSFLSDDSHVLADNRIRVPLMVRGRGVKSIESHEYVQNTDIVPILHHLAGLSISLDQIDGILPESLGGNEKRQYVFAESLYPGQTYKCVFKSNDGKFIFESSELVSQDGTFDLSSIGCVSGPGNHLPADRDVDHFHKILGEYLETSCLRQ